MLYAVSEILVFLLIATLLGIGIGFFVARNSKVSVSRALDRSGAHAAADRELAASREQIERLTRRLAVATEAIRELEGAPVRKSEVDGNVSTLDETSDEGDRRSGHEWNDAVAAADEFDEVVDGLIDRDRREDRAETAIRFDPPDPDDAYSTETGSSSKGGKRLAARVAEASEFSTAPAPEAPPKLDD